jgi:hypothetical protein
MRTRNLETLRRDAATACKWRGHSMRWSKPSNDGHRMYGECRSCGMQVVLLDTPMPNEIEIGGEAVALNCPDTCGIAVRYGKSTLWKTDHGYMAESSEGLTDWPVLQVEPVAPGFERFALWDHPEWFPLKFRRMVSKYLLRHEKELK